MQPDLDRRRTLAWVTVGGFALTFSDLAGAADVQSNLRINASRLQKSLEDLSVFGREPGGTFANGVSRFAYSDADIAGRRMAMALVSAAGAEPHIDTAGNIRATRPGQEPGLKAIMIGSHIDSVPGGGNFDGALGAMAAIEVLHTLAEKHVALRHPLDVVLWSNEEGGTVGSGLAVGAIGGKALGITSNGIRRMEGIRRIGGDPDRLADSRIGAGTVQAYIELHIEQSGELEKAGVPIGVVDGIVAIDEYEVEITGFANHAGTTPMADRRNALLAAAKLIETVQDEVTREPGRQVGNVGHLEAYPGARNVVPGRVMLTIELRDLDAAKIRVIGDRILKRAQDIALETRTTVKINQVETTAAAIATTAIQKEIEAAASGLGLNTMHLPSGAGHDAQNMAMVAPMGMIFVPSAAGISHSPQERTSWADCANGANMLLQTVLRLDRG